LCEELEGVETKSRSIVNNNEAQDYSAGT
jgi:hypothetical protein